ncbi:hypothetical protein TRFO_27954 [Tritrichomonas foetus]|uniref:HTH CENPB-type domain-containing protein n=1 Tax=Tritrichomonas foetus TaxID=1144522 RepID=A0A1J4K003_9EUKA|nr:hypothetical protein TRFO_27954 [Tritrichomonas foetus]|eukprot:OHT04563.1 hypothetical protein TRFO_27954 [Tritrichomonas foetus]
MNTTESASLWEEAFLSFESAYKNRKGIAWCEENGITYRMMKNYYDKWLSNPSFNPDNIGRGVSQRAFSQEEEANIYDNLLSNYAYQGIPISDKLIAEEFMNAYRLKHPYTTRNHHFQASKGFVWRSKIRNDITSRRSTKIRKNDLDQKEVELFMNAVEAAFETFPPERIVNVDEIPVHVDQQTQFTIARRGDPTPPVKKNCSLKLIITAVCWITASYDILPITFIAKGKSAVCQRNHGVHHPNQTLATPKGKANADSCKNLISFVSKCIGNEP